MTLPTTQRLMNLEPRALAPLFNQHDYSWYSASISPLHLLRYPSMKWWQLVENARADALTDARLLVRRDTRYDHRLRRTVIHDYITTKVSYDTLYGNWTHHCAVYLEDEEAPYTFTEDVYHERDRIFKDYVERENMSPLVIAPASSLGVLSSSEREESFRSSLMMSPLQLSSQALLPP